MRPLLALTLLCLAGCHSGSSTVRGNLDPTFGSAGIVLTDFGGAGDVANGVAVTADGHVVAVGTTRSAAGFGNFAVARYTSAGELDPLFNGGGTATIDFGSGMDDGRAIVLQADGRILVAGTAITSDTTSLFAVARLRTNGTPDPTWGSGGRVTTAINSGKDAARAIALQADGKVVVAGFTQVGGGTRIAIVRYTTAGVLDTTFNGGGKFTLSIGGIDDEAQAVAVQSDGKIVAAGFAKRSASSDLMALRLTTSGTADFGFGPTGFVTLNTGADPGAGGPGIPVQSDDRALGVGLDTTGRIVLAGTTGNGTQTDTVAVRLAALDGSLDTTYGTTGTQRVTFGTGDSQARSIAVATDGTALIAGFFTGGGSNRLSLARLAATGLPDFSFGRQGLVTTALANGPSEANAVLRQKDGKIVVAGRSLNGGTYTFALARYQ